MIRIGYEDLVANALIELNRRYGVRKVSVEQVENYRKAVLEKMKEHGDEVSCYINRNIFDEFVNQRK